MTIGLRYFDRSEFDCSHTGNNEMDQRFLRYLDELRHRCGFPFVITSGYRDPSHPVEAAKENGPGQHSAGVAADIAVSDGVQRMTILKHAFEMDVFNGIGVSNGFIHLDRRTTTPVVWGYDS